MYKGHMDKDNGRIGLRIEGGGGWDRGTRVAENGDNCS